MASTYSSNLKIELMGTGENSGTWGTITNTNLGTAFEQAVIGLGNPDYPSDANLTITLTNSNGAQAARALVLNVTSAFGSLTVTRELIVPTIQKQYIVQNNTTGGQSITVKTSGGTGITVPNGRKAHLYADGTNVIQMFDFVDINGGAIDGTIIGGSTAAAGTFTTATATTGNITTVNATTVDATNVEVTNIKAKDGTASIALADSTGVATIAAAPILTALTASQAVFTNGSKALVSNAITGTGSVVMSASATLTTPILGTPQSGTLTNATGLPITTGVSGLGAGVASFLATPTSATLKTAVTDETGAGALVFATSPTLVTPILGTPQSGTLTNVSGLPITTGVSGLGANVSTFLATPTSATLAAAVTDETGTGALVFAASPTLTTPILGTPQSGTLTNATGLPILSGTTGTLTVARGGTGVTTSTGSTNVVLSNSPTLVTPALGTPSSGVVTNLTGTASININGTVGATTANTGAFTTLTASTNLSSTRINPRVSSAASASTLTPDISSFDQFAFTALAAGLTINAPTGTPVDGNKLIFRFLDNGTTRTLTWNATFTVIGTTLPTATTANKMVYVGCIYNAANTRWDVVAVATQA